MAAFWANQGDILANLAAALCRDISALRAGYLYSRGAEHLEGIEDRHIFYRVDA